MRRHDTEFQPRLPSGFKDLLPEENAARTWMIETVCEVYKSHGFVSLDTSPVEYYQTLVSGHEEGGEKQIYRLFKEQLPAPHKTLALRFELTASLARFLAQNIDRISMPFKRYQSGYVWRGERPQRGRFRQFLQFDVDTVGVADSVADAEILEVIYRSLEALGIKEFQIRLSSRNLLAGLAKILGLRSPEDRLLFFRLLDKHDKIGTEKLLELLSQTTVDQDNAFSLEKPQREIVEKILTLEGDNEAVLEQTERLVSGPEESRIGIEELRSILCYWSHTRLGNPEFLRIVPHLARGLDYYTGPIFETVVAGHENIGSIMAGGRYDGLVGCFLGRDIPAVGVSMGVDRLFVALRSLGLLPRSISSCRVLVAVLSEPERQGMYGLASKLRDAGIHAELYLGSKLTFREQIKYASAQGIPFLLIQGEDERTRGVVGLRHLGRREQEELPLQEAIARLREA